MPHYNGKNTNNVLSTNVVGVSVNYNIYDDYTHLYLAYTDRTVPLLTPANALPAILMQDVVLILMTVPQSHARMGEYAQ